MARFKRKVDRTRSSGKRTRVSQPKVPILRPGDESSEDEEEVASQVTPPSNKESTNVQNDGNPLALLLEGLDDEQMVELQKYLQQKNPPAVATAAAVDNDDDDDSSPGLMQSQAMQEEDET